MEQAVNTFGEGLNLDLSPMVLGNKSLTNALNATFITNDENETILLNDMGNRRVDKAFLPPGYVPVGIKEHGGIIYIASYNPITGRSLLGSFPSPERISSDISTKMGYDFNLNKFIEDSEPISDKYAYIKNFSYIFPLTKENSLRIGDKFAIGGINIKELKDYISHYDNNKNNKIYSSKNKYFNLDIGVLNSVKTFVPISDSLIRYNDNGEILISPNEEGFYIKNLLNNEEYPISTEEFLLNRNFPPVNTYSKVFVSPLYGRITLNTNNKFSYSIQGNKIIEGNYIKVTLKVIGYIEYNCPDVLISDDKIINYKNADSHTYVTYKESDIQNVLLEKIKTLGLINFHLWSELCKGQTCVWENSENTFQSSLGPDLTTSCVLSNTLYDDLKYLDGIYRIKITKTYNITNKIGFNMFNYRIEIPAFSLDIFNALNIDNNNVDSTITYYNKYATTSGTLNLELFGTGSINISAWNFRNNFNELTTLLNYGFEFYEDESTLFRNLTIDFIDIENNNLVYNISNELVPSNNTITFNWQSFEKLNVYKVIILYDKIKEGQTERITLPEEFFITTELFNDCNVLDFGKKINGNYQEEILEKLKIPAELFISNNGIEKYFGKSDYKITKAISFNKDLLYSYKFCMLRYYINSIPEIKYNKELYPKYLNLSLNNANIKYNFEVSDLIPKYKGIYDVDPEPEIQEELIGRIDMEDPLGEVIFNNNQPILLYKDLGVNQHTESHPDASKEISYYKMESIEDIILNTYNLIKQKIGLLHIEVSNNKIRVFIEYYPISNNVYEKLYDRETVDINTILNDYLQSNNNKFFILLVNITGSGEWSNGKNVNDLVLVKQDNHYYYYGEKDGTNLLLNDKVKLYYLYYNNIIQGNIYFPDINNFYTKAINNTLFKANYYSDNYNVNINNKLPLTFLFANNNNEVNGRLEFKQEYNLNKYKETFEEFYDIYINPLDLVVAKDIIYDIDNNMLDTNYVYEYNNNQLTKVGKINVSDDYEKFRKGVVRSFKDKYDIFGNCIFKLNNSFSVDFSNLNCL